MTCPVRYYQFCHVLCGRRGLNSECRPGNFFSKCTVLPINIIYRGLFILSYFFKILEHYLYRLSDYKLWLITISGEYLQTQCLQNAVNCTPCPERLPSCIGLPDGNNPFPTRPNSQYYVKCFQNRTVAVEVCQVSLFEPSTRECSNVIDASMYRTYKLSRMFLGFCL